MVPRHGRFPGSADLAAQLAGEGTTFYVYLPAIDAKLDLTDVKAVVPDGGRPGPDPAPNEASR